MILVTVGTQDKIFIRLLETIENEIENGNIKEEVIVQSGYTKFTSKYMKILDFIPIDEFSKLLDTASLVITHAGVGSIMGALEKGKKVIAAARLKKYKEHTNDHQLQILEKFSKEGYILALEDFTKINEVINKANDFEPKKFQSNTKNMINIIEEYIDNN